MPLLLSADALGARRAVAAGPRAPLAASLRADLGPVLAASAERVWLPREKAELSRAGGVCPADGARLLFDPFAPRAHACPRCGRGYDDEAHYRWWAMGYQLWLAERAVHAAALRALGGGGALGAFAARVLAAHADAYLRYPNADNVLGPARPFFSTYLESLWLLHVCVALDLLESAGAAAAALGAEVRERVVAPSAALIEGYPEGRSNRQAWHVAARLAAARLLDRPADAERAVHGPDGLVALLDEALLEDGTWYEGENYHQFAHRGLWYAVRAAEQAGIEVPARLRARFAFGYRAPFAVALPDLSLPARRDSQYAVSLRQWRWAEWCEVGLADAPGDGVLLGALDSLYAPDLPRRDTGRSRATGESERNEPPTALARADLGWKALLFAPAELPSAADAPRVRPATVHEVRQGFAVFRRDHGRLWVGVDYGASGGGHGHADRLNLTFADGAARLLDDVGTGTYVERALHWYRSTLAHQAPLADGASQPREDGRLLAFDEHAAAALGWVDAEARLGPHASARRTVVVADAYVLDVVRWTADRETVVDLPVHVDGAVEGVGPFAPADAGGAGGLEDGFDFLSGVEAAPCAAGAWVRVRAPAPNAQAYAPGLVRADAAATWFRAVAPGPPGSGERAFSFVRQRGTAGRVVSVWDPRGAVASAAVDGDAITVRRVDGGIDAHAPDGPGWRLTRTRADAPAARDVARLRGAVPRARGERARSNRAAAGPGGAPFEIPAGGAPLRWALGAAHYLRSEVAWADAGRPTADVAVRLDGPDLVLRLDARLGRPPAFLPAGAENRLDNERADVNSDGAQLLLVRPGAGGRAEPVALAWLLVPEGDPDGDAVRATATTPAAAAVPLQAAWAPRPGGFALECRVALADVVADSPRATFALDLAVNERPPGRDRRRGQLVLSGAGGAGAGFVYLRGDRLDAARALALRPPP